MHNTFSMNFLNSCQSIVFVKNDHDVNFVTIQIPHK